MDHEREEGLEGKLDVLAWHNDCPLDTEATPPSRQERGMTIPDKFPSSTFYGRSLVFGISQCEIRRDRRLKVFASLELLLEEPVIGVAL